MLDFGVWDLKNIWATWTQKTCLAISQEPPGSNFHKHDLKFFQE